MWNLFIQLLQSNWEWLGAIGAGLAGLLAIFGYGRAKKREGASEVITEALVKGQEIRKEAKKDVYEEKRATDGLPDSDLVDRLRRRTNDWGGL